MMTFEWINKRVRPSEGWLVMGLLAAAVALLVTAVRDVHWTREDGVLIPTAVGGLLLGAVLAKRPIHAFWGWLLLLLYGLLITTITLANLLPPFAELGQGWPATRQFWLQSGAVFLDRAGSWLLAVTSGGSSRETIVFAWLMGMTCFLLAAFASWCTLRWQRPLPGLLLLGLVIALNGYFGAAQIWWLVLFVGVAVLLTAVLNFARLEQEWSRTGIDYPEEVRLESLGYATLIAILLLALALLLPSFSISRVQVWFASLTPVAAAESSLEQAFAGIQIPRTQISTPSPGGVGGSGILPRQYLLGISPELAETVVMTAVVTVNIQGQQFPAPPDLLQGTHWRALSYDVYTGQGWAISEERLAPTEPFRPIPIPANEGQTPLTQSVFWQADDRATRYTIGLPTLFDHATLVSWRGVNDLARVRAQTTDITTQYTAQSRLVTASPEQLRQARLEDVPPVLAARYTALPDDVPLRVVNLARDIAADINNPYDQARALEQFLRQYPYSLETPLPPKNADPVEYFLFELQQGYCDYYASSMVVMARALGLPARLAVGFAGQSPDEAGMQTIRQINAHSWAEVYFAGYGWVEFEPTASFISARDTAVSLNPNDFTLEYGPPVIDTYTPPIPPMSPIRPFPWLRLAMVALFTVVLFWWRRRKRHERVARADGVLWGYGRLQHNAQKLGLPLTPSQTPQEFNQLVQVWLAQAGLNNRLTAVLRPPLTRLTLLYNQRRYAGMAAGGDEEARRTWKQLQRPFWRLRLRQKFVRQQRARGKSLRE